MINSNYYQRGNPVNRIFRINQFFVMMFIILIVFSGTACNRTTKEASKTSDSQNDIKRRYLAIDKTLHGELRDVQMVMEQATDQKVIFEKFDNDWQKIHKIDGYEYISSVIRDDEGKFRIYYNVFLHKTDTSGVRIRRGAMAVAFSDDGINWTKPELNIAPNLVDHP